MSVDDSLMNGGGEVSEVPDVQKVSEVLICKTHINSQGVSYLKSPTF
jgi:hypothetical protein